MGTYPILAYVYFIWKEINFQNKRQKTESKIIIIALSFMFSVFYNLIVAMFFIVYKITN
jgi:hypothetical protein